MTRHTYKARLPSKLLAGCTAGLLLLSTGPCLGAESDELHAPLLDTRQPPLDFAYKGPAEGPADDQVLCTVPCSSPAPGISSSAPDPDYKHDFSLNLGQTGPVSFELTGSRLRMELDF